MDAIALQTPQMILKVITPSCLHQTNCARDLAYSRSVGRPTASHGIKSWQGPGIGGGRRGPLRSS
jgi:hypothetical protein